MMGRMDYLIEGNCTIIVILISVETVFRIKHIDLESEEKKRKRSFGCGCF